MLLGKINCFPKGLRGFSALQNVRKIRDGNWNQLDSNSFDIRTFLHSGALVPMRQKDHVSNINSSRLPKLLDESLIERIDVDLGCVSRPNFLETPMRDTNSDGCRVCESD
jgi:hypothetical protein